MLNRSREENCLLFTLKPNFGVTFGSKPHRREENLMRHCAVDKAGFEKYQRDKVEFDSLPCSWISDLFVYYFYLLHLFQ